MPSSILYHTDPKTSNKVVWYIIIGVSAATLVAFLYSKFFQEKDLFYQKSYYQKVSGIRIPQASSVLESYDNGEYWTATSFRLNKDSLTQFIRDFSFHINDSSLYKPVMFGESMFKIERLDGSTIRYLYNYGTKGKNSWLYIIDTARSIMWAEIQYPDWGGD